MELWRVCIVYEIGRVGIAVEQLIQYSMVMAKHCTIEAGARLLTFDGLMVSPARTQISVFAVYAWTINARQRNIHTQVTRYKRGKLAATQRIAEAI